MPLRRRRDVRKLQGFIAERIVPSVVLHLHGILRQGECSVRKVDATCSSVAGRPNLAIAIELPNTSWIQRTDAAGPRVREVSSNPRSWLSRGRIIIRCTPKCTALA